MTDNGLEWLGARNRSTEVSHLTQIMTKLREVEAWRETLTDYERARWSSPQSVWNRCPAFHPDGHIKGPAVKRQPMTVRELLHMPAAEIALLLYRRSPPKMFALMRAKEELAATGSVIKPVSGWATARAVAEPAQAGA